MQSKVNSVPTFIGLAFEWGSQALNQKQALIICKKIKLYKGRIQGAMKMYNICLGGQEKDEQNEI